MKRARRSKRGTTSRKQDPGKTARKILGKAQSDALDASVLGSLPRAKLLEACRALDLSGVSRLKKKDLVSRLLRALPSPKRPFSTTRASRKIESEPEVETPSAAAATEGTVVEHAARSREEFQAHKFALTEEREAAAEPASEPPPQFIPWSYGKDRVRAVAVDPERLYVYWEVTEEAKERAKARLAEGGPEASLDLRVYDTTGRLFDGTNAHSHFDHRIDNGDRQWFFDIGKPGSEAFVEIGLKSKEGQFSRIARSGKVSFPRRSPAPYREPRWLTVRAVAEPAVATEREPEAFQRPRVAPVVVLEPDQGAGPVSAPIERSPRRVEIGAPTFDVDGRTHVALGPWQVVVRVGAFEERHVLSRWMVYGSQAVDSGVGAAREPAAVRGASEFRLGGASELLYPGASERRLGGGSDRVHRGATERLFRGASERHPGGSSGRR